MTREETKEIIKVMQAFADGKKIECSVKSQDLWYETDEPIWNFIAFDYRIAPDQEEQKETHYRPYTMEEFIADMRKHDGYVKIGKHDHAYGYIINKIGIDGVQINSSLNMSYKELFDMFLWSDDGTPIGKEVEE